jgi:uncharacterized protein YbjT (DUF2867 family)
MTILITGATGNAGRHLVQQLTNTGHTVRARTRNPATANLPDGVEVVAGDLADTKTLADAFDGVTGLHLITIAGATFEPLPIRLRLLTLRYGPVCEG